MRPCRQFNADRIARPNLAAFEPSGIGEADGFGAIWDVPIDDTHTWGYLFQFDRSSPLDQENLRRRRARTKGYERVRTKANRYQQDREEMKAVSFAGLGMAFQDQDACVIEGRPIQDRSIHQAVATASTARPSITTKRNCT